jgi:hypothetical protein
MPSFNRKLFLFLCLPLGLAAQQKGEHFFSGEGSFSAYTYNDLSGGNNNDRSKNYVLDLSCDYGWFTKDNRSAQFGFLSGVSYADNNYIRPNGEISYRWKYTLGAHFTYTNYYSLLPKFYAAIGNDFAYQYIWDEGNIFVSRDRIHIVSYRLSPGLFYRTSPKLGLKLSLDLLTLNGRTSLSSTNTRSNSVDLNVFANSNVNSIYFAVIWFPWANKK